MKAKDLAKILMGDPEAEVFILDDSHSMAYPVGNASSIEEVEANEELSCVGGGDIDAIILVANNNSESSIQFDTEESDGGGDDEDDTF
jgi:hypothetical protein